ncbi:MAG TPA: acetyl-CoA carboxylase biotin carboxyl carrier protein [Polyangia bacterium]|jgi:acetyl-CoA carboxylase biotin carboxyl carrier protein|nr:acetyl-CoA carboxylase biotin carboxyl carrier protein [Polyangia bacterium]
MNKRNQSKARPSASAPVPAKVSKAAEKPAGKNPGAGSGIDLHVVRELARIAGEFNLSEVEADPGGHVRVRRQMAGGSVDTGRAVLPLPGLSLAPAPGSSAGEAAAEPGTFVSSPFVGTFYRAPSPDAAVFVEIGQSVRKGQVVCIVEAMKLMNEIESEADGRVAEILVQNGEHVEYGQPMIRLSKS